MLRRALTVALVAVVAVTCVGLGLWQLRRHDERRALNERIASRMTQPAADATQLLDNGASASSLEFRRASATGRYDGPREMLLLHRAREGAPGHHVVTPLVLEDGSAILVDRGWVPLAAGERIPVAEATPPPGTVRVTGLLLRSQERGRFGPSIPEQGPVERTPRIEIERLRAQFPYPLRSMWLQLNDQHPPQPRSLPAPSSPPALDAGPHLSYAIQWFGFAGVALVGYAVVVWRARRRSRPLGAARPGRERRPSRTRASSP